MALFKLALKIVLAFLFISFGIYALAFVMHILGVIFSLAIGVLFIAGIFCLLKYLFKVSSGTEAESKVSYKIADLSKNSVAFFLQQPKLKELVQCQDQSRLAEWVLDGKIIEIDNQTEVIVLTDSKELESVHVRVSEGKFKGRQGWVCKSVLHGEQKLISG